MTSIKINFKTKLVLDEFDNVNMSSGIPNELPHDGISYQILVAVFTDYSEISISFSPKASLKIIDKEYLLKKALNTIDLINQLLRQIRTFVVESTNYELLSPLNINSFNIEIHDKDNKKNFELKYTKPTPDYYNIFFSCINDIPNTSPWEGLEDFDSKQLPFIPLLVDAQYNYISGRYEEAIVNCATSLESYLHPILYEYFKSILFSKSDDQAESIMRGMSTRVKFDLVFGIDRDTCLSHLPNLLRDLKGLSSIRNKVIHKGYNIKRIEAYKAISDCCKFYQASFTQDNSVLDN